MITAEDIIAKAVWKLDRPPGEVTQIFHAWVDAAIADVRRGTTADIPGLGTLANRDGRVVFMPMESPHQDAVQEDAP